MGNDGGSIPGRQDLVREKQREKKQENEELMKQSEGQLSFFDYWPGNPDT